MRRVNIQAAFVGEPSTPSEALDAVDSDEAVMVAVRGGELTLVVPAGTPDSRVVSAATCLRGTLRLENERVLTFEINDAADGAYFEDEPAALHDRRSAESSGDMFRASGPLSTQLTAAAAPVHSIMSTQIVTVRPTTTTHELAEILSYHRISGVPVVDQDGLLVGVVTESDVIARVGRTVGDLMTRDVLSVAEDATIAQVAALIAERKVRRLPVVRDGRLVGLVSQADVVRWLAEQG